MNWVYDSESWWFNSSAKEGLRWRVVVTIDGQFSVASSDHGLTNRQDAFATLQAAKAYCEASENAFLAMEPESLQNESGFYWCYTLDDIGNPIESEGKPTVVCYTKENNSIMFLGYDMSLKFDPLQYRLLERLEYKR